MAAGAQHLTSVSVLFTKISTAPRIRGPGAGEFVIAGIKELKSARVSDTITHQAKQAAQVLPGLRFSLRCFRSVSGRSNQYEALRDSLEKLKLNDAAFDYKPEVSRHWASACTIAFLGLLHMEVVQNDWSASSIWT